MKWLFDLFKRLFGSKPPAALPAASQYDHPDLHQVFPPFSIKDAIIAAAKAMAEEQYYKEKEFLSDDKVREYFVKTFSMLLNELQKNDHYDFVMTTQYETKVPPAVWNTYRNIFFFACEELGIRTVKGYSGSCIGLDKETLKAFLANVDAPRTIIDDKVRALLHPGVYR
jgi:hypothetical protein